MLGDATFPAPLMPKSGHMANQHAKVAAAAIIQLLKGEPVNATPVVMNTCYSFVTARDAMHVASVHQYDAKDKTFKTVPGSGGVSAAANQIEGALRAVLGREHLGRHAGVVGTSRSLPRSRGETGWGEGRRAPHPHPGPSRQRAREKFNRARPPR